MVQNLEFHQTSWCPLSLARSLSQHLVADILEGRLAPGDRLPGSRTLAERHHVSRGTVVDVLRGLVAEGWLVTRPASGTFVAHDLPITPRPPAATRGRLGFDLPTPPSAPLPERDHAVYPLLGGKPDLRLLPLRELSRAYRRALAGPGRRLVDYGPAGGTERLQEALSTWLADTRGVRAAPGGLLVTRGSQQALYLLAHALLRPGDRVAVEAMGYRPAWAALASAGAVPVSIPVDEEGLRVEEIPDDVRAVYLTPHHQYPTGATLSAARRLWLLRWAAERRVALFEDDYDHEYHYDGAPVPPLVCGDPAGVVVYVGTLSKAFAPGLRLGFIVAAPALVDRLVDLRRVVDRQGDQVVEHAVAELIADGTLAAHLRRTRRVYAARRHALRSLLSRHLPMVRPVPRPGGMALWCEVESVDVDEWARASLRRGVRFETASAYVREGPAPPFVRLGFAALDEDELAEAVARMQAARVDLAP